MHSIVSGRRLGAMLCVSFRSRSRLPRSAAIPPEVSAQALEMLKRSVASRRPRARARCRPTPSTSPGELKAHGFAAEDITITPRGETATLTARYRGTDPKRSRSSSHRTWTSCRRSARTGSAIPTRRSSRTASSTGAARRDNKFGLVTSTVALIWLKQEGFKPKRDIILALSGDEETSMETTAALAQELKGAELLLNTDAGGANLGDDGKPDRLRDAGRREDLHGLRGHDQRTRAGTAAGPARRTPSTTLRASSTGSRHSAFPREDRTRSRRRTSRRPARSPRRPVGAGDAARTPRTRPTRRPTSSSRRIRNTSARSARPASRRCCVAAMRRTRCRRARRSRSTAASSRASRWSTCSRRWRR